MPDRSGVRLLVNEQVVMGQARFMCLHNSEISEARLALFPDALKELRQFFSSCVMDLGEAFVFVEGRPVNAGVC